MQVALEAEVTEFLGRDRYARAALTEDARPGSRNGYREEPNGSQQRQPSGTAGHGQLLLSQMDALSGDAERYPAIPQNAPESGRPAVRPAPDRQFYNVIS
jgi:hypothetical protein